MDWQPIETAPRDGTEFLVFVDGANRFACINPKDGPYVTTWDGYGDKDRRLNITRWLPIPDYPDEP